MSSDSKNLDLLRTIAVLLVVISHLPFLESMLDDRVFHLQAFGLLGVLFFFVHTSLVLMYSLQRIDNNLSGKVLYAKFITRRIFRIYPLSIFIVLVICVFPILSPHSDFGLNTVIANILLIQNLVISSSIPGALWSLPYEVQMYLALPLIYLLIKKFNNSWIAVICLWFIAILMIFVLFYAKCNYHLIKYYPCFIAGVLAFSLSNVNKRLNPILMFSSIIILVFIYPSLVAHGYKENLIAWPTCLIVGIIIPFSYEIKNKILIKCSKIVATYSYGIYLIHGPMIEFSFGLLQSIGIFFQLTIFVILTAFFSYVIYHLIEQPMLKLGVKISNSYGAKL